MALETNPKSEAFAYGSIIQTLTEGLYPNKKHVIRELVQNSYDGLSALKAKVPEEPIEPISIKINDSSIFVAIQKQVSGPLRSDARTCCRTMQKPPDFLENSH
jgi:hypothetical protein